MAGAPRDPGKYLILLSLVYQPLLMFKETTRMFNLKISSFKFDTNTNASSASQHALTTSTSTNGDGHISKCCHAAIIGDRCSRYTPDLGFLFLFLEHALTGSNRDSEGQITKTARDMTLVSVFLFSDKYSNTVIID